MLLWIGIIFNFCCLLSDKFCSVTTNVAAVLRHKSVVCTFFLEAVKEELSDLST